jgi:hypothetical protein
MRQIKKNIAVLVGILSIFTGCNPVPTFDSYTTTTSSLSDSQVADTVTEEQDFSTDGGGEPVLEAKEYLITNSGRYVYSTSDSEGANSNSTYMYKDYAEIGLVEADYTQAFVDDVKSGSKLFKIFGEERSVEYVKSFRAASNHGENSLTDKISAYNLFADADGNSYYLRDCDSMLVKYKASKSEVSNQKQISQETAIQISNTFLEQILGTERYQEYIFKDNVAFMFDQYWIAYAKYIHGYITSDEIIVCVNMDGTIASYSGMQISLYDNVENRIDKSMIEMARDELKDALYSAQLSNMEIVATQLVVNDQGNICLRLSVLHGDQQQFFDAYYLIID